MAEKIRSVIISGGTGLIGKALSRRLAAEGKQVRILTRDAAGRKADPGVELIEWDGRTTAGWLERFEGVDMVIHLAGANLGGSPWTAKRRQLIVSSRVESGQALVQAVRTVSQRPRVLIQASAVGYYGDSEEAEFTEDDPPGKGWLPEVCTAWEAATREVEDLGLRRVIIRTGLVLDREEGLLTTMALPVRMGAGGPIGNGRQWMSWIHREDEVNAILSLLENDSAVGAYNLTAPHPRRNADFVRALAGVLHRPYWLPAPAFAVRAVLGKMSELALKGQNVQPKRLEEAGFHFDYPDLTAALADLYGNPVI